jgi:hypothetical protein
LTTPKLFKLESYFDLLDRLYPRILNQIDRDPHSPTLGSCDRNFWMCRLHDFDSGVLQQGALFFSSLVELSRNAQLPPMQYIDPAHQAYWEQVALSINERTENLLTKNGYLDEYYPGEKSLPGTVFAAYSTLKSALYFDQQHIINGTGLEKTAENLIKRLPSQAANQDTAAAAFLALYSKSHSWKESQVTNVVENLLSGPDQSGRFLEYGGGDLGYATVSLNYLACMIEDDSFDCTEQLTNVATFIADFVSPTGGLGGEFASRSTTYFLPFGLIVAAEHNPDLTERLGILDTDNGLGRLDDRYIIHYCGPSLSMATSKLAQSKSLFDTTAETKTSNWVVNDYRDRGLLACTNNTSALFLGLNKGGVFQLDHSGAITIDSGYRITSNNKTYATCILNNISNPSITIEADQLTIVVKAPFLRYRLLVASSIKTIILRLMQFLGPQLNVFFKRLFIQNPEKLVGVQLERLLILNFLTGELTVEDNISGLSEEDEITTSPASPLRVVPSARFYQDGEIDSFLKFGKTEPHKIQKIYL